jgi:hypothetical protein
MDHLKISLSYEWQRVLLREKVEYSFPLAITPFMRMNYKGPAVYRFNIYQKTADDKKLVYIGEAEELCPRRLYGFLNPGPTQKINQKIKTEFEAFLKEGLTIRLDICNIHELKFGDSVFGKEAAADLYTRRMLEVMMIVEHRKRGFTVLDL